ncbi:hypothetical protein [Shinella sp. JR1-6]|uniref:hypothetical protein n=1 Tax=Shinella sp. JR1-6 TaxID=2527671 RepID=UPI00102D424E|nr:hypothetical protein [Shinella sp. JR1-6]TAA54597.1 hypothetical protein EXZ48_26595 [Shinella sp. JR1-6]
MTMASKVTALWGPSKVRQHRDCYVWEFSGVLDDGSQAGWRVIFYFDTRAFKVLRTFTRPANKGLTQVDMFPGAKPKHQENTLKEMLRAHIPPAQLAAAIAAAIQYQKGR